MILNKKHPATALIPRCITKAEFKSAWQQWRSLNRYGRYNELDDHEYQLCWWVDRNKFSIDPLLVSNYQKQTVVLAEVA